MAKLLILFGAGIFGVLGTLHLIYTFFGNKFEARDPAVTEAMKTTSPFITRDSSMWDCWIGFNASHSLGAILVAAVYIPLALYYFEVLERSLWFSVLPVVLGLVFMGLAARYWFKIPLLGVSIATLSFSAASILINS